MKATVLIVDDDAPIRESLRKVLQAEGYEVVLAANGMEGLDLFGPTRIDLVLLDLNLPAKSGWDLFERFTSLNPLLPVIVITGRNNQYRLAAAAGVGALMEKPLDVPLLLQTISEMLAEQADARLKRLVGMSSLVRYAVPGKSPSKQYQDADFAGKNEKHTKPFKLRSA